MLEYHGIIVDSSLRDKSFISQFKILSSKPSNTNPWNLYLVQVPAGQFHHKISLLQKNMIPLGYYAHFYRDSELIIIFPDKIFKAHVRDRKSWMLSQEYGINLGISREQLGYKPVEVGDERACGFDY
jgi:hypothetical protein